MIQVFVDLDGVMADFDRGYETAFGIVPDKETDNVDWNLIKARPGFYAELPLMPDAMKLWDFVSTNFANRPVILTGVPKSIPGAAEEKRVMVDRCLGSHVPMIACASRDKCKFAKPGDVLIDDWTKYRDLWLSVGGRFITHTSAENSIQQLLKMEIGR